MKRKFFGAGALTAPLPPAMVTVGDFENANVLTIGWTGILASQPPRTYVSIRPTRYSHGILKEGGEFVINLPSADMARVVDYVGIYTGKKVDKFKKCHLTKQRSEKVSPPTISECPIALECRVTEVVTMGSHDVFFADILSVSCRENIIDEAGKMRYDLANLLAYAHGEYYALGERVGRFGFSTDKEEQTKKPESKSEKSDKEIDEKKPFYEGLPKGKRKKSVNKDKGAPHRKGGVRK